jgi:hypothetical protein
VPPGISRRRLLHGAAVAAGTLALGHPARAQVADVGRHAMAGAATAFLGSLDTRQRRRAVFVFGDAERMNWHYVPRRREGLTFKDMGPASRTAAHELMKASLSAVGYAKALNVIALEDVLRQIEMLGLSRDPENYAFTIFGTPGASAPWGWRLEGHHLSLNFTLVPGRPVVVTPAFMGANPATVRTGPRAGLRTLEHEQDLGLALARGVDPALRGRLVISATSLGDVVSGPGRRDLFDKSPAGVALSVLSGDQRALAVRLVETYARDMRTEMADEELRRMRAAGLEQIHFAWAGPIDPARPHYYRIHGPTLLIEYDNTQNDANHIHSVWHDPVNDFGADLLRAHYARGHHHA